MPMPGSAWEGWKTRNWDSRDAACRQTSVKAMDLDKKLVGPWQESGLHRIRSIEVGRRGAGDLDQAVRLDPTDSPMAWYFSAMADYNLGRFAATERSIKAEIKLDHGANPHAQYLLGLVLIANRWGDLSRWGKMHCGPISLPRQMATKWKWQRSS